MDAMESAEPVALMGERAYTWLKGGSVKKKQLSHLQLIFLGARLFSTVTRDVNAWQSMFGLI